MTKSPRCHVTMYNQNVSLRAGPCGKFAKLAPIDSVKRPNRDFPPKADTPMLDGMNHPADPIINASGSFLSHSYPSFAAARTTICLEDTLLLVRGVVLNPTHHQGQYEIFDWIHAVNGQGTTVSQSVSQSFLTDVPDTKDGRAIVVCILIAIPSEMNNCFSITSTTRLRAMSIHLDNVTRFGLIWDSMISNSMYSHSMGSFDGSRMPCHVRDTYSL